jgi:hypothetical protein
VASFAIFGGGVSEKQSHLFAYEYNESGLKSWGLKPALQTPTLPTHKAIHPSGRFCFT